MKAVEQQIQDTGQVGGSNEYPPVDGCNCGRRGAKELFRRPCPFHAVPKPVSTEGATAPRRSVVKNKSTAAGREFWDHVESIAAQVAAPIAPAAVSEEKRMLDAIETARALGYRDGHIDGRKEARSQFAKPSAEGDGWIAVTEAYPPDAVTVRVRAKSLRRTHSSPYSGVDGEYDGFYDHEEAQWQCYTGPHDSAHLWDCDVEEWLPAPPSGQGEVK